MQALLLNKINNEFVKVKKDVNPLVMCPTEYNRGWADSDVYKRQPPESSEIWRSARDSMPSA